MISLQSKNVFINSLKKIGELINGADLNELSDRLELEWLVHVSKRPYFESWLSFLFTFLHVFRIDSVGENQDLDILHNSWIEQKIQTLFPDIDLDTIRQQANNCTVVYFRKNIRNIWIWCFSTYLYKFKCHRDPIGNLPLR